MQAFLLEQGISRVNTRPVCYNPCPSPYDHMKMRKEVVPNDPKVLHELTLEEYSTTGKFKIDQTPALRILDKAAVKSGPTSPWILCPVTQVEETKQMLKMIPIPVATFIPSTMLVRTHTLFVKQFKTLVGSIGPHFEHPHAFLTAFVTIFMLVTIILYDQLFVPAIRKFTKNSLKGSLFYGDLELESSCIS